MIGRDLFIVCAVLQLLVKKKNMKESIKRTFFQGRTSSQAVPFTTESFDVPEIIKISTDRDDLERV